MDIQQARKIGATCTVIGASYAVLVGYLIYAFMASDLGWIFMFEYSFQVITGIFNIYIYALLFGSYGGKLILIDKRDALSIGFLVALTTLVSATFFTTIPIFMVEGISAVGTPDDPFIDYIFKPMFWVILVGFLPTSAIGLWIGNSIKKRGAKLTTPAT
jgi:hypothetical protein